MNVAKGRLNMANISNTVVCDGNDTPFSFELQKYSDTTNIYSFAYRIIIKALD